MAKVRIDGHLEHCRGEMGVCRRLLCGQQYTVNQLTIPSLKSSLEENSAPTTTPLYVYGSLTVFSYKFVPVKVLRNSIHLANLNSEWSRSCPFNGVGKFEERATHHQKNKTTKSQRKSSRSSTVALSERTKHHHHHATRRTSSSKIQGKESY